MAKQTIIIISCGKFEKNTTQHIIKCISDAFHLKVKLRECTMDVSQFYNPARRQYNANLLLEGLTKRAPEGYLKYMGIFNGDLFIPILTFIFGQAQLNGNFGIASSFRLRNELYGLKEDNPLMLERLSKVVVHELAHTFGLIHCLNVGCVMRSSNYVEDLDQKEIHFCPHCRETLDKKLEEIRISG